MTLFRSLPRSTFALPLVALASQACIESGLKEDEDPAASPEPNILVDPPAIGFPATAVGDEVLADFTVENVGDGALEVFDLAVVAGVASVLPVVLVGGLVATALAVYALRGVYFSLLAEGAVPVALTGTAVGLVSVIGYTPDVFFGPMMGVLLDRSPGAAGHRDLFAVLAAFAGAGLLASLAFGWFAGNAQAEADSRSMP